MKNLALIILSSLLVISCLKNKETTETNDNVKVAESLFEHFNEHEWSKMANLYIENAEFKDPSLGNGIIKQSQKQIVDKYSEMHKMFPDIHDKVISIYPSGDNNVIVEFISSGTAPDKSKFELPICTIFTIENGKITKDFTYYDNFEEPK